MIRTRLQTALFALTITFGFVLPSGATTLTFETGGSGAITSYTEAGYAASFTGTGPNGYHADTNSCNPTCADDGSFYLMSLHHRGGAAFGATIRIVAVDNHAFTFTSFTGAEDPFANNNSGNWAAGIAVTGFRADNTTVSQTFLMDQINDGSGGLTDFQLFTSLFSDAFVRLDFTGIANTNGGHDFAIDDLTLTDVQTVPEPASLLLLGSGLTMCVRRYRRKTSA